jgi:hypothetical protein
MNRDRLLRLYASDWEIAAAVAELRDYAARLPEELKKHRGTGQIDRECRFHIHAAQEAVERVATIWAEEDEPWIDTQMAMPIYDMEEKRVCATYREIVQRWRAATGQEST